MAKLSTRLRLGAPPPAPVPVTLDADQQRVLAHRGGPLAVLGGAGSGRTTTVIETAVDRIDAGVPANSVLVLTFSRRAATEVRNRIAGRLGARALPPQVMTIHGLCHSLLRRFANPDDPRELRLLTAPEQEFRVREVLAGIQPGTASWPDDLQAAVHTRSFAAELRAVFARARQLAMDPEDLVEVGQRAGRPEWVAAGEFMGEYLDVLDGEGVLDYDELVHRTRLLVADPVIGDQVRSEIAVLLVDEFHDLDPAQIALIRSLTKPSPQRLQGAELIVFADPDQSVYAFRGANTRAVFDFADTFGTEQRPDLVVLGTNHRQAPRVAAALAAITDRIPVPRAVPREVLAGWRAPACGRTDRVRGQVQVLTFDSPGAEADQIADILRHAHLHEDVPWSSMAVMVRNGRSALPGLGRALVAAGVPVEIAGDEIPLAQEPSVRPLLLALEVADNPQGPDADQARRLLTSPLGGLDAMGVRRLGRALREAERAELAGTALAQSSAELVRRSLGEPELLAACQPSRDVERAQALAALLATTREQIRQGAGAEEALWTLWNGTGWGQRLRASALCGGDPARAADRDLDAVLALFDLARRSQERSGNRGVTTFSEEVANQQIPADTQREGDLRGGAVRLLTAHRAKGAQWRLVVVAGVQEGVWPDLRRRGTLLEADRLTADGLGPGAELSGLLAEERRLFQVACSRARDRLVITAVTGTDGEGDQPSRFLTDLAVPAEHLAGRPRRPLNLTALVGELRRTTLDPQATDGLRAAAASRLAQLIEHVPAAHPDHWWGIAERTLAQTPVTDPRHPVRLSGSGLESLLGCPRRWFAARKARGDRAAGSSATIGSVVHAVLDEAANVDLSHTEMVDLIDQVWGQIPLSAVWFSEAERDEVVTALGRYQSWAEAHQRTVVGSEVAFDVTVDVADDQVQLTGKIDRIERDALGGLHVIDFKTGRRAPAAGTVATNSQLGVYQLAIASGALADLVGPDPQLAGAELVYVRDQAGAGSPYPKVLPQASIIDQPWPTGTEPGAEPSWIHQQLARAAEQVRSEQFPAVVGDACRYCAFSADCPALAGAQQVVR